MKRQQHDVTYAGIPAAITFAVLLQFTIHARHILLVYWLRGGEAYDAGIRSLQMKPSQFSDGQSIPQWAEIIAFFAAFVAAAVPALALYWVLNLAYKLIRLVW